MRKCATVTRNSNSIDSIQHRHSSSSVLLRDFKNRLRFSVDPKVRLKDLRKHSLFYIAHQRTTAETRSKGGSAVPAGAACDAAANTSKTPGATDRERSKRRA